MSDDDLITVCDHCFCACCWQGEFFCDEYKTAGTTKMTRGELKARRGRGEGAAEHEHYWKTDEELCAIADADAKRWNDARKMPRAKRTH